MCIFKKKKKEEPIVDSSLAYGEESRKRAQENYDKGMAEWEVFKDKPFKYKVGDKFICWIIIEADKNMSKRLNLGKYFSYGFVNFWDLYHLINTVTGETKYMYESDVDFLAKARDVENNLK